MNDPRVTFSRAAAQTAAVIAAVRPDQATRPTPCTEWDVRTLVGHVLLMQNGLARGLSSPVDGAEVPVPPDQYVLRYRENVDAIDFLRRFNQEVYGHYPDVQTFAEESTSWGMVSRPTRSSVFDSASPSTYSITR